MTPAFYIPILAQADTPDLTSWLTLIALIALLPFLLAMITSFAKLVIVGGILRQALGLPQVPPNIVITGLALILSIHIMWPVITQSYANYQTQQQTQNAPAADVQSQITPIARAAAPPLHAFLTKHSTPTNRQLFQDLRLQIDPNAVELNAEDPNDITYISTILAPAFVLSELIEAFQIGLLLFIPFVIIDLVVSNILLAMGMHMLNPLTISFPLKLLLFVLIDGWTLVVQGLILGYT